jgi:hypothetical protein
MEAHQSSDEKVVRSHCRICHGGCKVGLGVRLANMRVPSEGQGILTGESPEMLEVPPKAG